MLKAVYLASLVGFVGIFMQLPSRSAQAVSSQSDVCLINNVGATTVINEDQVLLSHDAGGAIFMRDITLPAGTYNIEALSYEPQHPNDPIPGQATESWFVNLYSGGQIIYTSPATLDIPDELQTTTSILGTAIELPNVDAIEYVHAGYPEQVSDPSEYVYNSVYPSCVSFTLVESQVVDSCSLELSIVNQGSLAVVANVDHNGFDEDQKLNYSFDWGDGLAVETTTVPSANHSYSQAGTYQVVVSVANGEVSVDCSASIELEPATGTIVLGAQTTNSENDVASNTVVLAETGNPSLYLSALGLLITVISLALYLLNFKSNNISYQPVIIKPSE